MILNGSVLGSTVVANAPSLPSSSEYQSVTINGDMIYDFAWNRRIVMTDDEIRALTLNENPIWDGTTVMLATYTSGLGAGSVESLVEPVTGFDINRRRSTDSNFIRLAELEADAIEYNDVTAEPNTTYIYEVLAKSDTDISEPILADPFDSNFYNWILLDPDTGIAYIFDLNLRSDAFSNEIDYVRYDGYNKYSQFTFGDRDFVTGSVSAIVASNTDICNGIEQSVDFTDEIRAFINNKKEKILKSRKGHVIRVVTTDYEGKVWLDEVGDQPYRITFNFTEVGAVHGS